MNYFSNTVNSVNTDTVRAGGGGGGDALLVRNKTRRSIDRSSN